MRHLFPLLLLATACEADPAEWDDTPALDDDMTSLIYGRDNRMEYYQLPTQHRAKADAVAVMLSSSLLTRRGSNYDVYTGFKFRDAVNLCTSEPYRDQPAPGECSAFLVGPNTIATAGHCISSSTCSGTAFVFGFRLDSATSTRSTVPSSDVYFCSSVIARATSSSDYALVRVDRTVTGRTPLPVRTNGTVPTGTPLVLAGHPYGIPLKIAPGGTVRENYATDWFGANLDSYGGNSGSPVINATNGVVEGILVRGNNDFVRSGRCYVSATCPDTGCPGFEEATRATRWAGYIP